ncbi:hypothetical protein [Maritalea sp.]|uniref:hypothetical protein n=1 Tax=Maritalea sp. TaxID=2003361 RepID=UPI003EF6E489
MRKIFLATVFALSSSTALAADGDAIIVTIDAQGQPKFEQKPVSFEQAILAIDPAFTLEGGAKPTAIILEKGKPARIATGALEDIDRQLGGDGNVDIIRPMTDAERLVTIDEMRKVLPIDIADLPETMPLDLFEGVSDNQITLKNGTWKSEMTDQKVTGCPPGLDNMASQSIGQSFSNSVVFSSPYHPTDFSSELGVHSWKRVGNRGYISEIYEFGGEQARQAGIAVKVRYGMNALSPTKVAVWANVQMNLAEALAKMAGGSTMCVADVRGHFVRVSD